MDKHEAIEILKTALEWYQGDDTVNAFQAKQAFNYFEDVIDYIKDEKYYWRVPLIDDGYLNYSMEDNTYICASKRNSENYQTIFTESEIRNIERRHNVDLSFLQKEPLEDEE